MPLEEQEPDVRVALSLTPPAGAPVDRLTFHYDVIFHHLITHTAVVTLASDWRSGVLGEEPVLLGTMRDTNDAITVDRSGGSWLQGFAAMFRLGARHIAEGTDHLLFLLALILPAPLVAAGGRWGGYAGGKTALRRIVKVVTAFTVGHSITLVIGALGWARLPGAVVESAIAFSILISAVHALIPIFQGREVFIAGGFGLAHGLAFASTLTDFGFDPLTMVSSVLGFNLGIEAFQLLVILLTMPWLVLLARSRVYGPFRIAGAALTIIAAAAWFAERAFGWVNPIVPLVEIVASHALWVLAGAWSSWKPSPLLSRENEMNPGNVKSRQVSTNDPMTRGATKLMTIRTSPSIASISGVLLCVLAGAAVPSAGDYEFRHENVLGTSLELCVRADSDEAAHVGRRPELLAPRSTASPPSSAATTRRASSADGRRPSTNRRRSPRSCSSCSVPATEGERRATGPSTPECKPLRSSGRAAPDSTVCRRPTNRRGPRR